jgi:hypothetical protein
VIAGIRQYLGGWPGIGRVVAGMARQQYGLQLTRFGQDGWSTTLYPAGIPHSLTPMVGSGWAREPGAAVQRAAWEAFRRRESAGLFDGPRPRRAPPVEHVEQLPQAWPGRGSHGSGGTRGTPSSGPHSRGTGPPPRGAPP